MPRPPYRCERLASNVMEAVSEVFSNLCSLDKFFDGLKVNCTGVKVSPDLRRCSIYVALGLEGGGDEDKLIKALEAFKPRIRFLLAKKVSIKFFPEIAFMRESKSKNVARVYEALCAIKAAGQPLKVG